MPTSSREAAQAAVSPKKHFSLISDDKLRQLYASMLECRMLQERAHALAKSAKHRPTAVGREAAAVGVTIDLQPEDVVAHTQGDVIAGFLKGAPLHTVLTSLHTPANGHAARNGHAPVAVIPPAPTLTAQLGLAAGAAFAAKVKHSGAITVAFTDSSAAEPAAWCETLRFAAKHKLPVIYVTHSEAADLSPMALDCGLPGIPVDGNDVVAVYRVAFETITRVRQGQGPTLIECKASGNGKKAANGRQAADPIANMERYLTGKGLYSERWKQKLVRDFSRRLDSAEKQARRQNR